MIAIAMAFTFVTESRAFPPAPHHLIYGTVKDQYGTPLQTSQAQIVLTTPTGIQLFGMVVPELAYEMNYELEVPMDSGLTPDLYTPNALTPFAPFSLAVVIGGVTNRPIEVSGNYSLLGQPGQQTRIDLTMGLDSNGDGLPDAWEQAFLYIIGSNLSLSNINANSKLTSDGRTLRQQYLTGNYPYDPFDLFYLTVVSANNGAPLLQFTAMMGKYYTIQGSADLKTWTPISFTNPSEGVGGPVHSYFYSSSIQSVQLQVIQPSSGTKFRYFRMAAQ